MAEQLNYDVIALSAQAEREVDQDMISITFSTVQAGPDSNTVQEALIHFTNEALEVARAKKKGSQVRVETSGMQVGPAYDKDGNINGYRGTSSITVLGTDTKTISGLTGEIKTMSVTDITFSVSPALAKRVLKKLTFEAISNFKEKALEIAAAFGSSSHYRLINANVNGGQRYRGAATAMALSAGASLESVQVEGGKEQLTASVSGSIQLLGDPIGA